MQRRPWAVGDAVFRQGVAANIDVVVKRAEILACKTERENVSKSTMKCTLYLIISHSNFRVMELPQQSPSFKPSPTLYPLPLILFNSQKWENYITLGSSRLLVTDRIGIVLYTCNIIFTNMHDMEALIIDECTLLTVQNESSPPQVGGGGQMTVLVVYLLP